MKSNCKPEIINYLSSINLADTFCSKNKLRHPGGIYNISSDILIKSLNKLISVYKESNNWEILGECFRIVIYDFFKFYDSCFEILACFCDGSPALNDTEFIDKWITKNKYNCAIEFKRLTSHQIREIKYMYNKLKHTSNTLGYITMHNEKFHVLGYYLLAFNEKSTQITAHDKIYPISLNREIKRIFFLIHELSSQLLNILEKHISQHNPNIIFKSIPTSSTSSWEYLYENITSVPNRFLKNEIGKSYFTPFFKSNGKLAFKKNTISIESWQQEYPNELVIMFTTISDGYTKQFAFPHMGMVNPN